MLACWVAGQAVVCARAGVLSRRRLRATRHSALRLAVRFEELLETKQALIAAMEVFAARVELLGRAGHDSGPEATIASGELVERLLPKACAQARECALAASAQQEDLARHGVARAWRTLLAGLIPRFHALRRACQAKILLRGGPRALYLEGWLWRLARRAGRWQFVRRWCVLSADATLALYVDERCETCAGVVTLLAARIAASSAPSLTRARSPGGRQELGCRLRLMPRGGGTAWVLRSDSVVEVRLTA